MADKQPDREGTSVREKGAVVVLEGLEGVAKMNVRQKLQGKENK